MTKSHTPTRITLEVTAQSDEYETVQSAIIRADNDVAIRVSYVGAPDYLASQRRQIVTDTTAHIVKCVNAYPALIEAAKLAMEFMQSIQFNDTLTEHEQAVLDAAQAAIAAAK